LTYLKHKCYNRNI